MKSIFLALSFTLFTAPSWAAEKQAKPKTLSDQAANRSKEIQNDLNAYNTGVYGMAGCGLGSIVIKENTFAQIFATTTNGTLGNQTFGITSGTSNCVGNASRTAAEQEVFIRNNYAQLSTQAAQGQGEYLDAFAELLGCEREPLLQFSQNNRAKIFASPDPQQVLGVLKEGMKDQCKRLG